MRTPAGTECPHYYEDFHRGRNRQECRLIDRTPDGGVWHPKHCSVCPVPRIVQANGCPNLVLEARARSAPLGIRRRVEVTASCLRTLEPVEVPEIGCGFCHEALPFSLPTDD